MWWFEQQLATACPTCSDRDDEAGGDPDWVRALEAEANGDPVHWAIPGVTGLGSAQPLVLPSVSPAIVVLQAAVARAIAVDLTSVPGPQALVDSEALLAIEQQLRVHSVRRVSDVNRRGLMELVGFRSVRTWLRARRPDGDSSDAVLGAQLQDFPIVHAAIDERVLSLSAARRLVKALRACWNDLDRPDGLIDGQPGEQVMTAVVSNVIGLVCRHLRGLADHDPRLEALIERGRLILQDQGSQRTQLETAVTMLAEHLPPRALTAALEEIVAALLPSELEEAADRGHDDRLLELFRKPDGSGWRVRGDLDLECGERLFTALRSEAARDPDNPQDTAAWQRQREHDADPVNLLTGEPRTPTHPVDPDGPVWPDLSDQLMPRSKGRRMHDALNRLLARYLEQGLGGTVGKNPVQLSVTLDQGLMAGQPGAAPARADSGALIPATLIRRWWCDSHVTAFVMSLGGKALRVIHAQRTLTGVERKALQLETGGRCAGQGCCPETPDPLLRLTPHHVIGYATAGNTSLDETVLLCDSSHFDIHDGKRTIALRDGRYLNHQGIHDQLSEADPPPF